MLPFVGGSVATAGHTPHPRATQRVTREPMRQDAAAVAVARWFAGVRPEPVPHVTMPRTVCHEGEQVLPAMRRNTWFRLARLVQSRAEEEFGLMRPGRPPTGDDGEPVEDEAVRAWRRAFTSRAVRQMIATLGSSDAVNDRGEIDPSHLVAVYAIRWEVSARTAWRHWSAMWSHGLVRQRQAPCPDRKAVYVLTFPPARVPDDLPPFGAGAGLDVLVASWDDARTDTGDVPAVSYGPAGDRVDSAPDYLCQAFPLFARAKNPSLSTTLRRRTAPPPRARIRGGVSDEERIQARMVLERCRPLWRTQLEDPPTMADLAELLGLVAVARRYATQDDLVELLASQVATARDLVGLVRWRLQKLVNSARRAARIEVDDAGDRYRRNADAHAELVKDLHQHTAGLRAQVRAAADAAKARRRADEAASRARRELRRAAAPRPGPAAVAAPAVAGGGHTGRNCECADCRLYPVPEVPEVSDGGQGWLATQRRPAERSRPQLLRSADDPRELLESLAFWSHPK